jgi:DNA polymerase I
MIDYGILLDKGIVYCDTAEKAIAELWRLRGFGPRFGIDTETKTLDPHTGKLRLVQIADINERVGIFDTWKIGKEGNEALAEFIANQEFLKIFHHAKYDIKFLRVHLGIKEIYPVVCTMIEASLLACGNVTVSKSLPSVLMEYLGIPMDKTLQVSNWSLDELSLSQIEYAAEDAKYLIKLHRRMFERIKTNSMEEVFRHEMNCIPVTAEMEINGMPLNFEAWCKRADEDEAEAKKEQLEIFRLCDPFAKQGNLYGEPESFNINSPIQLKERFHRLGIPIPIIEERDGRRRETTGKDQLKEIEHVHPVISHIINQRILHKAYTTYGRNWSECINFATKRVHANYNQNGSETGRFTTGEDVSEHMDPPMLGIPRDKKYRSCFEAGLGRSLVWGDYSQIELRILADFANDKNLLQAFIDGRDPHLDAAERLFGISQDKVTSEQRHLAKDLNYAIPYGVAPPKFAIKAHITEEESKTLISKYFEIYPNIKSWLENAGWRAINQKSCRTASGRLLRFSYDKNDKRAVSMARRNGKNAPIQGTCSDIIKVALFFVYKEVKKTEILICHVFHDEIILECPDELVSKAKEILNRCMVNAGKYFLKRVPIKVDVKSGRCWGK